MIKGAIRKGQRLLCVKTGAGVYSGTVYRADGGMTVESYTDLIPITNLNGKGWNQVCAYRLELDSSNLPDELKETKEYEI